jgi:hypothetical protein
VICHIFSYLSIVRGIEDKPRKQPCQRLSTDRSLTFLVGPAMGESTILTAYSSVPFGGAFLPGRSCINFWRVGQCLDSVDLCRLDRHSFIVLVSTKGPTYREIGVDRFYPSAYFPSLPIVR